MISTYKAHMVNCQHYTLKSCHSLRKHSKRSTAIRAEKELEGLAEEFLHGCINRVVSMEKLSLRASLLAVVVILFAMERPGGVHGGQFNEERVNDLLEMRANSKDGVIRLDDESLQQFTDPEPEPRPYSLILFFDAIQLRSKTELKLELLRAEYGLVAKAYAKNNPDSRRVFFVDLEYTHSEKSFKAFGVAMLPHIRFLPPGRENLQQSDPMEHSELYKLATSMVYFVEAKTKQTVGPIERPPAISTEQLILFFGGLLAVSPFVIKRVMTEDTLLHDPKFWCFNVLLVYFFCVSGGMNTIIRGTPFVRQDENNPAHIHLFHQGGDMQLGAEVFVIGCLYTLVGLLLASVTYLLHEIRSKTSQRLLLLGVMGISFFAIRKVITLNVWKTNYHVHGYWPHSWR